MQFCNSCVWSWSLPKMSVIFPPLRFTGTVFCIFCDFKPWTRGESLLSRLEVIPTGVESLKASQVTIKTMLSRFNSYQPSGCTKTSCHHQLDKLVSCLEKQLGVWQFYNCFAKMWYRNVFTWLTSESWCSRRAFISICNAWLCICCLAISSNIWHTCSK